ncbi:MAG: hypothetical protein S4CHLAM7_09090 [Chlamydiae bacterium]|nr:hypothetical protein [Chlamydiota bacterium]
MMPTALNNNTVTTETWKNVDFNKSALTTAQHPGIIMNLLENQTCKKPDSWVDSAQTFIKEQIEQSTVWKVIKSEDSAARNIFNNLVSSLSNIYYFQILPGASAEETSFIEVPNDGDFSANKQAEKTTNLGFKFSRGFLPTQDPVYQFKNEPFKQSLSNIVSNMSNLVLNNDISKKLDESHKLLSNSESDLLSTRLRMHSMITSLVHAYILEASDKGSSNETIRLPQKILEPFLLSAKSLNSGYTQTYETYILQNWKRLNTNSELSYENIEPLFTYTGLDSEKWFIKVHVMSEYYGAPAVKSSIALKEILSELEALEHQTNVDIKDQVIFHMDIIADSLLKLAENIAKMKEHCDPKEFFYGLRPYLKNHQHGFFIDTNTFENVFPGAKIRSGDLIYKARGASGAQSSIIPAIDACFSINITQEETMSDMLNYMPRDHVELINWLTNCKIKDFVSNSKDHRIGKSYNAVIDAVTAVRKVHFDEIIEKYIMAFIPSEKLKKGATGSGGTDFTKFLPKNIKDTEHSSMNP